MLMNLYGQRQATIGSIFHGCHMPSILADVPIKVLKEWIRSQPQIKPPRQDPLFIKVHGCPPTTRTAGEAVSVSTLIDGREQRCSSRHFRASEQSTLTRRQALHVDRVAMHIERTGGLREVSRGKVRIR